MMQENKWNHTKDSRMNSFQKVMKQISFGESCSDLQLVHTEYENILQ